MTNKQRSNEIMVVRVYDAPVNVVWDAWTDSAQTAQWWGPRGFILTSHSKELRAGGVWHYTMHGPDGVDYPNKTVYHEVVQGSRLVYDHGGYDDRPPMFQVTVLFAEAEGKTTMDMRMSFPTTEAALDAKTFIKQAGGNATWDRLAEYLAKTLQSKEQFVINQSFDAPIDTVFEMWSNPNYLAKWMGPAGSHTKLIRADIRPGGSVFYKMSGDGGYLLYGKSNYIEIEKPIRLVYTQQFCDENENLTNHPMAPVWPTAILSRVEFAVEGPNQTRVTVTWEAHGQTSPSEVAAFVQARSGMTQGWTGSFDCLEVLLRNQGLKT